MARPSEQEVEEALRYVRDGLRCVPWYDEEEARIERILRVLSEASRPRRALPAKDFADMLGVDSSNLNDKSVAGLPKPAYTLPRPTEKYPDRVARFWWEDEAEVCARAKRARLGQSREDGAK